MANHHPPDQGQDASGIYHLPGMLNYERARPDRCYRTTADAEADGLPAGQALSAGLRIRSPADGA